MSFGQTGRRMIEESFDINKMGNAFEKVYKQVLEKGIEVSYNS